MAIRNAGDLTPPTSTRYFPGADSASKSSGYTKPYVSLHAPALVPTGPVNATWPSARTTENVAPDSVTGDMR